MNSIRWDRYPRITASEQKPERSRVIMTRSIQTAWLRRSPGWVLVAALGPLACSQGEPAAPREVSISDVPADSAGPETPEAPTRPPRAIATH